MPTLYRNNCERCGRAYVGMGKMFCSSECRTLASRNRIAFTCKGCGSSCERPVSHRKYHATEYCSLACWYKFAKGKGLTGVITTEEKTCPTCLKVFTGRAGTTYCSRACVNKKRPSTRKMARLSLTCGVCGVSFGKLLCQVIAGRGRCCSRACSARSSNEIQGTKRSSKIENVFFEKCIAGGALIERNVKIGRYFPDAVSADGKTVFEFDGNYWHSLKRVMAIDKRKDKYLHGLGMKVVRIPEKLFKSEPEKAIAIVLAIASDKGA